ncbi:pantothenate kinase [Sugiyamaella lignohabitans]|uniref:Pantothenate kinase n=1 Tax=Sugiyamaella lignohabitans TaxID=796027 RepID=A0A161HKK6_9ASCO|nr:pantothenate kinase [Sugiyamaella lignohabitans]ANB13567.1 pantothenate kinase [Sugiyamaella lignohabitans]
MASRRRLSAGAEIAGIAQYDLKILNPGDIVINVEGAFIVDEDQVDGRLTPPDTRDIALPHHTGKVSHIAVDIGGTLAKVVYFTQNKHGKGGRLNFTKFESSKIDECIDFLVSLIKRNGSNGSETTDSTDNDGSTIQHHIVATGGGSYKFYDRMRGRLGSNVSVSREDEMECLISGLDFFITQIPEEVFCYSESNPMSFPSRPPNKYPCLLVNMGSGVSMLKVLGPRKFVRVGGSSLGGGTLWGLLSLLTDAGSYDEMLEMAATGDNSNVDMLVGDIYGTDYARIGLKASTIASSFGKVFKKAREEPDHSKKQSLFDGGDISRSLLYAISNNIGQIAYLQAQNHQLEHIYFGGSYIRGHPQTMHTLSYAINFWSKGEKTAYFLRHEGYLGAVGAFMQTKPTDWIDGN